MDNTPGKKNKNHINVVLGYTNDSGFWNITSVFPVLSQAYRPSLMMSLDVTSAAHSVFSAGKFKMPNLTIERKNAFNHWDWEFHKCPLHVIKGLTYLVSGMDGSSSEI